MKSFQGLLGFGDAVGHFFASRLRNKKLIFWGLLVIALAIIFRAYIKPLFVMVILAVISVFSTFYKRFMRVPPAVELVTFSTVMVGIAYGPVAGGVFGAVITLVAEIANSGIDAFIVGYIPARAVIGVVSSFFPAANIVRLGVLMSLLYNLISQPLYAFQSDIELRMKLFAFLTINVPFNFIVFSLLGNIVKNMII